MYWLCYECYTYLSSIKQFWEDKNKAHVNVADPRRNARQLNSRVLITSNHSINSSHLF